LTIDPLRKAHLLDAIDFAGLRAVAEAIEGVQDGFVLGKVGDGEFALEMRVEGRRQGRGLLCSGVHLRGVAGRCEGAILKCRQAEEGEEGREKQAGSD
jgi:hypothetical protein